MAEKRLFKEYNSLLKKPASSVNNQIIFLAPVDSSNNILEWGAVIAKPSKEDSIYYYNGQWNLDIAIDREYPRVPPNIRFSKKTPINHPNVNFQTGEICLDILKADSWSPAWNLEHTVVAILLLIDNPEPDSPLNIDSANLFRHDKVAYESIVQYNIWKHDTFYEVDGSESLRRPNGIKPGIHINNEDAKEELVHKSKMIENETIVEVDSSKEDVNSSNDVKQSRSTTETLLNRRSISNIKAIQDVGEEVTKQFIAKVDEIGHTHQGHDSSADTASEDDLYGVKQQVTHNVNKQVKKLCSQSVSPEITSPKDEVLNIQSLDEITDVKQKFLSQVNDKVNEIIKPQEGLKDSTDNLAKSPQSNSQNVRPIKSMVDVIFSE